MRYFLIILIWWFGHFGLLSQNVPGLTHIGIEDGLSQGFVNTIVQDREGFIWLATLHGLNRYDGYAFKTWFHDVNNATSLPSNIVNTIAVDHLGRLWAGTAAGLRIYDRQTDTFRQILGENGEPLAAAEKFIWKLIPGEHGRMSVEIGNEEQKFVLQPDDAEACRYRIVSWGRKTNPSSAAAIDYLEQRGITLDPDYTDRPITLCGNQKEKPFLIIDNSVYQLAARRPAGALFPAAEDLVFHSPYPLKCAFQDRSDILWLGTNALGLLKYDPSINKFRSYAPLKSVYQPICIDRDRVGFGQMLRDSVINITTGKMEASPWSGDYAGYFAIGKDSDGALLLFDPALMLKRFPLNKAAPPATHKPIYSGMVEDPDGNILLCNREQYLLKLRPGSSKPEMFNLGDGGQNVGDRYHLSAIVMDPEEQLWIGTKVGLIRAVPSPDSGYSVQRYTAAPGRQNGLSNNTILSLMIDTEDPEILWLGTKGGGLNRFNTATGNWQAFTTADGLPDNVVYGLLPDPSGSIWISSNRGLCLFDPETLDFQHFTIGDGLQSDEFNTHAYSRNEWGELIFGGVNGITRFNPADITRDTQPPSVFITGLQLWNQPLTPGDSTGILDRQISYTETIQLDHRQNMLTFSFAVLDYSIPEKNRYRYRLLGANSHWVESGANRVANYSNLTPGSYTFEVMGANRDGIWSETPARLNIRIFPPWWQSPAAYVCYGLLITGLVIVIYRFEYRRIQLKHQLIAQQRIADHLKDLDTFKSNFYTNITHEFRTPLTVILGISRELGHKYPAQSGPLNLIRRNGEQLLNLINRILDLAKAESDQLQLNWVQADLVGYLNYQLESFLVVAAQQKVDLTFHAEEPQLMADFDPEKLQWVFTNLLSNALKFTASGGKVVVSLGIEKKDKGSNWKLSVQDNGPGIAPEDLPQLFDQFYQGKESAPANGSGIGLAMTRRLVQLMGGEVEAGNLTGGGAYFTVRLPLTRNAPVQPGKSDSKIAIAETAAVFTEQPLFNDGSRPKLLMVEDNPDVAAYLHSILSENYQIHSSENGEDALEAAFQLMPDIILSDVMMPGMDGLTLCDRLKKDTRTSHIPIVLLTARVDMDSKLAGLRKGADDYLAKPFHREELLTRLERLLELRRKLQQKYREMALGNPVRDALEEGTLISSDIDLKFLDDIQSFLSAQLDNADLKVEDICKQFGMGKTTLHQKLTALTGMPPMQLVQKYRLNNARELLRQSDLKVAEVAYRVGFEDPKYFSRLFAREFGLSPSNFRKQSQMP